MIRSIAVLPPCFASKVHVSGSNPKAASVSSALFIIMKCLSLPAPLRWNDLVSLREESLLVFQAENSTFFLWCTSHNRVPAEQQPLSAHQQPPDSLLLMHMISIWSEYLSPDSHHGKTPLLYPLSACIALHVTHEVQLPSQLQSNRQDIC